MTFSYLFENNIKLVLPEIFLACSIISILMFGCFTGFTKFYKYPIISLNTGYLLVLVLFFTSFLIVNNSLIFGTAFNGCFVVDWLAIISKVTVLISSIACLLISMDYINSYKINSFEYFIVVALSVFGQLILISSCDFVMAYIALEIQSFCFYLMASFKRDSAHSTEAGLKYFLLGSFSSTLLLFGLSLIYGGFGTTNFSNLSILLFEISDFSTLSYLGFTMVFVGLLFKLSAAPFHIWSPDVYEGSPFISTVFFAVVPKISVLVLLLRVFVILNETSEIWCFIFLFCSIFSVIIGAFVTLKQKRLKKLLAYSGINHIGYILLGLSFFTVDSISSVFLYMLVYMITGVCTWGVISMLNRVDTVSSTPTVGSLTGLVKINPLLAFIFSFCLFSLAGIPPLLGFYAKFGIFQVALNSGFVIIGSFIILTSVVSTFYYIRLIKSIYFENTSINWIFYKPISAHHAVVVCFSFFVVVLAFYNPLLLGLLSQKMALTLLF